jgi:hypothetical protein
MFHGAYTPALVKTLSGAIISVLAKFPMGVARLGPPPDQVSSRTCKEKPMTTTEALPPRMRPAAYLRHWASPAISSQAGALEVRSPITGEVIARVREVDAAGAAAAIAASNEGSAFGARYQPTGRL